MAGRPAAAEGPPPPTRPAPLAPNPDTPTTRHHTRKHKGSDYEEVGR